MSDARQTSFLGKQRPRVCSVPASTSSVGEEAVQLASEAGLRLDPWQAFVVENALSVRRGRWAAFEVAVVVPRQNGKGAILEALELAGLFLLRERLIIHSAHQFDTSLEAFRRLLFLIEENPEFSRRVKRVSRSHGEEGVELRNGQRVRFRTRTKGGGRGFSCDRLILDEAMILPQASHAALLPTLSARPNPQVVYTGSAVDQEVHDDGLVLARLRERGLVGDDPSLAYFEWSVDASNPADVPERTRRDPRMIAVSNPGLGLRIPLEYVENERSSMDARSFNVERLGVGDWPSTQEPGSVIPLETWFALGETGSTMRDPVAVGYSVSPNRKVTSIAVAGRRRDGNVHVEVIETQAGTSKAAERLAELTAAHENLGVFCAGASSKSLSADLEARGVELTVLSAEEDAQACGRFYDLVEDGLLRHLNTPDLAAALRVAVKQSAGDGWRWDRRTSGAEIAPLVAVTHAAWGVLTAPEDDDVGFVSFDLGK